jgi:hypothetical protein
MNKKFLLLVAALAGVALTGSTFAYSPKTSANPAATTAPRLISSSVVKPIGLPQYFAGALLNVEFSLDQTGQPHHIKVLHVSDPMLKRQIVAAFSQWRFETRVGDPAAGVKRFILPIELSPEA